MLFSGKCTVTKGDGPAACFYTRGKAKVKVRSARAPPGSWRVSYLCEASTASRTKDQTAVVLCYFTYFLGYKMFYFIGVLAIRWESSTVSRTNLHQSSVTESYFVWTSDKDSERFQGFYCLLYANTDQRGEPCDGICKLGKDRTK